MLIESLLRYINYFYKYINIYLDWIFIVLIFIAFLSFIYNVFKKMVLSGFTKESSLDHLLFTMSLTLVPFFYHVYTKIESKTWFVDYFLENQYLLPLGLFSLYILLRRYINKWSSFKLWDIYGIHILPIFCLSYLYIFFITLNVSFLIVSIVTVLFYHFLKSLYTNKFSSLFKLLVCKKDDEVSFIGGVGILFLFFIFLLSIFNNIYTQGFYAFFKSFMFYIYLIFLIYLLLLFYRRLKFFNIKCHLVKSFWKNKKEYYLKKDLNYRKKLID